MITERARSNSDSGIFSSGFCMSPLSYISEETVPTAPAYFLMETFAKGEVWLNHSTNGFFTVGTVEMVGAELS